MDEAQRAALELRLTELKKLLASGADLKGLMLAASSAHDPDAKLQKSVLLWLLEQGADLNERDKNGVTPLHRAVRFRSPAAVNWLIQRGADVNAIDRRSGSTPLHRAVTSTGAPATAGKGAEVKQILELLFKAGADASLPNKRGSLPLEYVRKPELRLLFERYGA